MIFPGENREPASEGCGPLADSGFSLFPEFHGLLRNPHKKFPENSARISPLQH